MAIPEKDFFLNFDRPVPCSNDECNRLTTWAHAEFRGSADRGEIILRPLCWEHGFAERDYESSLSGAQLLQEENASVERFVVMLHDGQGKATVIDSISWEAVSAFEPIGPEAYASQAMYEMLHMEDRAWHVRYEVDSQRKDGYVVWVMDDSLFEWYPAGEAESMDMPPA